MCTCRGCYFSLTTAGNVRNVCPFKITKMCVVPLLLWETGLQHWAPNCFLVAAVFFHGCVLLKCLSLLELPGYCEATWNDSWVWQMSGTAGCVLDYPKSLDNAVIHHCPNYLCIDCRSLCDSTVMANYPGYLWYLLYSVLEELKKKKEWDREREQERTGAKTHQWKLYSYMFQNSVCFSLHETVLHGHIFIFSLSFENGQISSKIDKEEMQRVLTMMSHGQ